MIKYKDKVRVISDFSNGGFYEGAEGLVISRRIETEGDKDVVVYGVYFNDGLVGFKEEELEKID